MRIRSHTARALALALGLVLALGIVSTGCAARDTESVSILETEGPSAEELINTTTSEVSVFYPAGDTIVEERVVLDDDTDALRQVLDRMFATEELPSGAKVTLPRAEVLGVTVEDGLATVDFSAGILGEGESEQVQQIALVSIIRSVAQFPGIERVGFTVEGRTQGTAEGKDIATLWGDVRLDDGPWSLGETRKAGEGTD